MARSVGGEALAIGFALLLIFVVIHVIMMGVAPDFSMTHAGIFLGVFLAGALGHVAFEMTGANQKFCDSLSGK